MYTKHGLTPLEEDLLTLLAGKSLCGVEIQQVMQEVSPTGRILGHGSLYPKLALMVKHGLLEKVGISSPSKRWRAVRVYYGVTVYGLEVLQQVQRYRQDLAAYIP